MKCRQIGDVFTHPYEGSLKVVEAPDGGCAGCVFDGGVCQNIDRYTTGECSARYRIDHTEVVFVKAKEEHYEKDA